MDSVIDILSSLKQNNSACLNCGKQVHGRSDKKYCNDFCRNEYNNLHSVSNTAYMRRVNYILRKNRNILLSLLPFSAHQIKVSKEKLLVAGFHFALITNVRVTKKGLVYQCYDFEYQLTKENCYLIKRQAIP